jgi:hypothetical protein
MSRPARGRPDRLSDRIADFRGGIIALSRGAPEQGQFHIYAPDDRRCPNEREKMPNRLLGRA